MRKLTSMSRRGCAGSCTASGDLPETLKISLQVDNKKKIASSDTLKMLPSLDRKAQTNE